MTATKNKKQDVYACITEQVIQALENSIKNGERLGQWELPWQVSLPKNISSNNTYQGINLLCLSSITANNNGFTNIWGTFAQFKSKGFSVKRGEKSIATVVFFKNITVVNDKDEENKTIKSFPLFQSTAVFNSAQTNYEPEVVVDSIDSINPIESVEKLIKDNNPKIVTGGNKASYNSVADIIKMPDKTAFYSQQGYYSTLLHELVHWTGNKNRLERNLDNHFGSEEYAKEELIAELGSAMLCAQLGVSQYLRLDHLQYMKSWLSALRNDTSYLFVASRLATQAIKYLIKEN
jgi:antirestriction protein ArdC